MPRNIATGEHALTFEHRIEGGCAAEYECRCRYEVDLGRPAIYYPPPGEPPEGPEIREISDIEVEIILPLPKGDPRRMEGRSYTRAWVRPPEWLEAMIRQYLYDEGAERVIDSARNAAAVEDMVDSARNTVAPAS